MANAKKNKIKTKNCTCNNSTIEKINNNAIAIDI